MWRPFLTWLTCKVFEHDVPEFRGHLFPSGICERCGKRVYR
jgi:hypothetical protein